MGCPAEAGFSVRRLGRALQFADGFRQHHHAAEADTRRTSAEGVNLDQELISMTTYQQAFSASARLVQAGKDLYDVLLQMVG